MLQVDSITQLYPVISAGPDWITATARRGSKYLRMSELGHEVLQERRDAGRAVSSASRFGFKGQSCSGFFYGERDDLAMIQASGPDTVAVSIPIIEVADNVSRLDLQATVWTHGEQPHLAMESYQRLTRKRHVAHRPGQVTLIQSDPVGETLNVNKRTSDSYGRFYDKASEAKIAPPRTIWRMETEFKRRAAAHHAAALARSACPASYSRIAVHRWWSTKGVDPCYDLGAFDLDDLGHITEPERNVLAWFEKSVSITVARAVKHWGLSVTLAALGLDALVTPNTRGGVHHD